MKTKATPLEYLCDERIIVDFHEMISLLIGKDAASRQEFRNEVFRRAAEIRARSGKRAASDGRPSNIIHFPKGYSWSA